jgi:hypothetical protein
MKIKIKRLVYGKVETRSVSTDGFIEFEFTHEDSRIYVKNNYDDDGIKITAEGKISVFPVASNAIVVRGES